MRVGCARSRDRMLRISHGLMRFLLSSMKSFRRNARFPGPNLTGIIINSFAQKSVRNIALKSRALEMNVYANLDFSGKELNISKFSVPYKAVQGLHFRDNQTFKELEEKPKSNSIFLFEKCLLKKNRYS